MLVDFAPGSNDFAPSKIADPCRGLDAAMDRLYKSPSLQISHHPCVATLSKTGFAGSIVLSVWISGAVLFGLTNARSASAPKTLGGADHKSAVSEIKSVLHMQQDAWNRGDIDRFMNGYAHSRDTVFISEDTVRRGWETVRDRYREKYSDRAKMGVLTFSDLEIVLLSADSAVALGRWKLQRAKDRPHGRFTLILRRLPEGWRIVHDHTSAAPP
jgi:ketosteroid isomerase-like protein